MTTSRSRPCRPCRPRRTRTVAAVDAAMIDVAAAASAAGAEAEAAAGRRNRRRNRGEPRGRRGRVSALRGRGCSTLLDEQSATTASDCTAAAAGVLERFRIASCRTRGREGRRIVAHRAAAWAAAASAPTAPLPCRAVAWTAAAPPPRARSLKPPRARESRLASIKLIDLSAVFLFL